MADHNAEQILTAVMAKVTGLATTGANAFRARPYPLNEGETPAVFVFMGADQIQAVHSTDYVLSLLEIKIAATVAEAAAQVDTVLNQIRKEITIALAGDHQLGLPGLVQEIEELGADEPDIAADGDRPTASMETRWAVTYARNRIDPSTV